MFSGFSVESTPLEVTSCYFDSLGRDPLGSPSAYFAAEMQHDSSRTSSTDYLQGVASAKGFSRGEYSKSKRQCVCPVLSRGSS